MNVRDGFTKNTQDLQMNNICHIKKENTNLLLMPWKLWDTGYHDISDDEKIKIPNTKDISKIHLTADSHILINHLHLTES